MHRCPNCQREFYASCEGAYCPECWRAYGIQVTEGATTMGRLNGAPISRTGAAGLGE
jgi:hypothetical protein